MNIQTIFLLLIFVGVLIAIFLLIKQKTNKDKESENKEAEEIANLKTEIVTLKDTLNNTINTSLGTMSTSFNNLSTGVTKDMTEALIKASNENSASVPYFLTPAKILVIPSWL